MYAFPMNTNNNTTSNRTRFNLRQRLDFRLVWNAEAMNQADLQTVMAFLASPMPTRSALLKLDRSVPVARAKYAQNSLSNYLS